MLSRLFSLARETKYGTHHLMAEQVDVDIDKLATLARLHLTENEKNIFASQIPEIVGFFNQLNEIDTDGVEPTAHPYEVEPILRKDEAVKPWSQENALKNAPSKRDDQVIVPKVVDDA